MKKWLKIFKKRKVMKYYLVGAYIFTDTLCAMNQIQAVPKGQILNLNEVMTDMRMEHGILSTTTMVIFSVSELPINTIYKEFKLTKKGIVKL